MNILIVNDDGIESKGIGILARALAPHGKIYVSAPLTEQSGKSQSISLKNKIEIVDVPLVPGSIRSIAVNGTPADATRAGLSLFNVDFDLVVSGINNGPNIAKDVLYSGTVGAAYEAKIYGVDAIAVSADDLELDYLYDEVIKTLDEVIENEYYRFDGILNINFPKYSYEKPLGVQYTVQGQRYYHSEFIESKNENIYYHKGSMTQFSEEKNSDVWAYENGYISITPLTINRTDYEMLEKFNKNK